MIFFQPPILAWVIDHPRVYGVTAPEKNNRQLIADRTGLADQIQDSDSRPLIKIFSILSIRQRAREALLQLIRSLYSTSVVTSE